ncbi:arrestin domain-containing protein 5 isoform X2 [Manduca sexta]|uniref:arrestin domain-containing protein 5 isoform X2 n=1 Tax=Manduca sexta TaxID=7130 RepID=UPI00118326FA|nr:arrestin domain-containing protein 5 isoform X2 [Manduca sexta]
MACDCVVRLNSDSTGSFYTGDIVTGIVVLDLQQDQKIESIDFEVIGTSKAQWTRSAPTIPYIKLYSQKSKILSIAIPNIFSEVISGKTISAGIYTYPFHFALPDDLPSTFESSIAKIEYRIKIKSKPFYKIKKVVPFVVLNSVNVNHIDAMLKLNYVVQSGYFEEEKKMFKVEYKKLTNTVSETCNFQMEIPQLTPSSIHLIEPMVNISYEFRVEVIFPFHFTLHGSIPVTIATIPVLHYDF